MSVGNKGLLLLDITINLQDLPQEAEPILMYVIDGFKIFEAAGDDYTAAACSWKEAFLFHGFANYKLQYFLKLSYIRR